ncbi:unnamed protein product [Phytomonas sp. EM1]|nr:unnamed protein product [Phytomonas sp. EM1]|eukprot:CCW63547.1 unnamed protein product [Phytomonas sp. isolate EM1]
MRLPVELEPEYSEGFTCDSCGEEVMKGPFYHQEQSGTDFCISCGNEKGLTPFNGLIASLFFAENETLLLDSETHSVALFGFKIDSSTYGFFFDDKSNLIFRTALDGSLSEVLYITNNSDTIVKTSLGIQAWKSRYSWVDLDITHNLPIETMLHPSPQETTPFGDLFISDFSATENSFSLTLGDGWEQSFNVGGGTEIVRNHNHTVMFIVNFSPSTG